MNPVTQRTNAFSTLSLTSPPPAESSQGIHHQGLPSLRRHGHRPSPARRRDGQLRIPPHDEGGGSIEILLNATAGRNPNGQVIGVVGIGQDITGRIAQEREYTRLIDTANALIFGVDTQCGKICITRVIFVGMHCVY
jgi:hypothetical protein